MRGEISMTVLMQLLALAAILLHFSTAAASSILCVVGNHDLTLIPISGLMTREEDHWSDGDMVVRQIIPCQQNTGYVVRFIASHKENVRMDLKDLSITDGIVKLNFETLNASSSTSFTLRCGDSVSLVWLSGDHTVENSDTSFGVPLRETVLTKVVCSSNSDSSSTCGHGCTLLVFLLIILTTYVIVTILLYFFRDGKRGMELIPHREFWADFPFLVRDGAVYVYHKITGCFAFRNRVATFESVY